MMRSAVSLSLFVLAGFFLAAAARPLEASLDVEALVSGAAPEPLDPETKISLSLKDAKLSDLIATLGAMANLPVFVDPGIDETVSIQVHDASIQDILQMISQKSGLSIRIENGKLIASKSSESVPAAATLPDAYRGAPKILVSEFDNAKSAARPVYATFTTSSGKSCYHYAVRDQQFPRFTGRIAAGADAPAFFLTEFYYEPVSKIRYFALEYGGSSAGLAFEAGHSTAFEDTKVPGGLKVVLSETSGGACQEALAAGSDSSTARQSFRLEVHAMNQDGGDQVVMARKVELRGGSSFVITSEVSEEKTGEHRQVAIRGYLARDGRSVLALLTANAIWIYPADGQEYYYMQPEKPQLGVRLHPLTEQGETVARLDAGVAAPRPLELRVFSVNEAAEKK